MARARLTVFVRVEAEDAATPAVKKAQSSFASFADYLKSRFVFTLQDVANAARAAVAIIFDTGRLEGQTQALRIQLAQQGQSFDTYIAKLDQVARGTISTADLVKASSSALLLGIPADKIADLLEVARASAIATGTSTAEAFRDIAVGIGRASPLILDNLGIVVKLEQAYSTMADSIGKSTDELTPQEQKQGLLNAVLDVGIGRVKAYGEAHSALAEALETGQASVSNFRGGIGTLVSVMSVLLLAKVVSVGRGFLLIATAIVKAREAFNLWTNDLEDVKTAQGALSTLEALDKKMEDFRKNLAGLANAQWAGLMGEGADATDAAARAQANLAAAAEDTRQRLEQSGAGAQKLGDGLGIAGEKSDALGESLREAAAAARLEVEAQRQLGDAVGFAGNAAVFTARAFDELARAQGRQAATEAAVAGGARLILGGTRLVFRGGSRLTSEPGLSNALNGGRFV